MLFRSAIVKTLVELHGGTVEAHSEGHGRGSEFAVRLPAARAGGLPEPSAPAAPELAARPDAMRVLVVDDNEDAADLLAMSVRLMAHLVRVAHDGPTALQIAAQFQPDVALLDIGLPGMDGYALAQELRRRRGGDRQLLVAITGYGQEADQRRAREAGFDRHLVKPVDPETVLDLLAGCAPQPLKMPS